MNFFEFTTPDIIATRISGVNIQTGLSILCCFLLQYYKTRKKFLAHDEVQKCQEGDLVFIQACRPISKRKAFNVTKIVERAPQLSDKVNTTKLNQTESSPSEAES